MVTLMRRVEVVVTRDDFGFDIRDYVGINFHMTKVQKITNHKSIFQKIRIFVAL